MIHFVLVISSYDPRPNFRVACTAGFYFDWMTNASEAATHLRKSVCDALLINCRCDRSILEVCSQARRDGIPVGCHNFNDCPHAHNPQLTPPSCVELARDLLPPRRSKAASVGHDVSSRAV